MIPTRAQLNVGFLFIKNSRIISSTRARFSFLLIRSKQFVSDALTSDLTVSPAFNHLLLAIYLPAIFMHFQLLLFAYQDGTDFWQKVIYNERK